MRILIITGGSSSERAISLISAKAVKKALLANGYQVDTFDFKKGYLQLHRTLPKYDLIFPVMHGKEGEDGKLYKFLSSSGKPFIGADPKGARVAFNKIIFKKYCKKLNIRTPNWRPIRKIKDIINFGFPCVLKGAFGGSSHEIALLYSRQDLKAARTKKIFNSDNNFFIEKMVQGTEITVGVLYDRALPVLEIVPPDGAWFDYKNKYSGKTKEIPFAPSVNKKLQHAAQKLAVRLHKGLGLGDYSRTDMIVDGEKLYVLELNTPGGVGLTPTSLFPKAAKAANISFKGLINRLVQRAMKA